MSDALSVLGVVSLKTVCNIAGALAVYLRTLSFFNSCILRLESMDLNLENADLAAKIREWLNWDKVNVAFTVLLIHKCH